MYTSFQQRVVDLLDTAAPKEELQPWIKGYVPKHYKRLTCSMEEAKEMATAGAAVCNAYFDTKLFFTQSLIFGAVLGGKYKRVRVVTTSQYGKSFLCGFIALYFAWKGEQMLVAGGDADTTKIIMGKIMSHIQIAADDIKQDLLEPQDKLERLQTAVSKDKLVFRNGGGVESISLGASFADPLKGNKGIGRGGNVITDEASRVPPDNYAETGRREFADVDGESYWSLDISNPHNPGRFWEQINEVDVAEDTLVIWMDCRTALEEGRIKSIDQVIHSEFFANKSTCIRYLLCELEDLDAQNTFGQMQTFNNLPEDVTFFIGGDSAYKGKDNVYLSLGAVDRAGNVYLCDCHKIYKDNWEDGVTGQNVVDQFIQVILKFGGQYVCIDIGYGVYLVEGLAMRIGKEVPIVGINFGAGTTKSRVKQNHFAAKYGANMRAEMHLDLADLIDHGKFFCHVDIAKTIQEQMNAVRSVRTSKGKTGIIPKDQIKQIIGHSPDELDSVLLMVHSVILYHLQEGETIYS